MKITVWYSICRRMKRLYRAGYTVAEIAVIMREPEECVKGVVEG